MGDFMHMTFQNGGQQRYLVLDRGKRRKSDHSVVRKAVPIRCYVKRIQQSPEERCCLSRNCNEIEHDRYANHKLYARMLNYKPFCAVVALKRAVLRNKHRWNLIGLMLNRFHQIIFQNIQTV